MALTRLKKGIQHCGYPAECLDYKWRVSIQPLRLNRCKAPGSICCGGCKSPPYFRLARDENCLTSVIFALEFQCRHREADENQSLRCRSSNFNAKIGFTTELLTARFVGVPPTPPRRSKKLIASKVFRLTMRPQCLSCYRPY